MFARAQERILNAIYPPTCIECASADSWLCESCFADIASGDALTLSPFRHAWALSAYKDRRIQRLVKSYKYRAATCLEPVFQRLLSRMLNHPTDLDIVTWVPGDPDRVRERGIDHGKRLAKLVANALGHGLQADALLLRSASALPNATLPDNEARKGNIKNAFSCIQNLEGKRVLLIDDVCTTGATAQACANLLIEAGAEGVDLLVFAKG